MTQILNKGKGHFKLYIHKLDYSCRRMMLNEYVLIRNVTKIEYMNKNTKRYV